MKLIVCHHQGTVLWTPWTTFSLSFLILKRKRRVQLSGRVFAWPVSELHQECSKEKEKKRGREGCWKRGRKKFANNVNEAEKNSPKEIWIVNSYSEKPVTLMTGGIYCLFLDWAVGLWKAVWRGFYLIFGPEVLKTGTQMLACYPHGLGEEGRKKLSFQYGSAFSDVPEGNVGKKRGSGNLHFSPHRIPFILFFIWPQGFGGINTDTF